MLALRETGISAFSHAAFVNVGMVSSASSLRMLMTGENQHRVSLWTLSGLRDVSSRRSRDWSARARTARGVRRRVGVFVCHPLPEAHHAER